jgi:hypothetical protein
VIFIDEVGYADTTMIVALHHRGALAAATDE